MSPSCSLMVMFCILTLLVFNNTLTAYFKSKEKAVLGSITLSCSYPHHRSRLQLSWPGHTPKHIFVTTQRQTRAWAETGGEVILPINVMGCDYKSVTGLRSPTMLTTQQDTFLQSLVLSIHIHKKSASEKSSSTLVISILRRYLLRKVRTERYCIKNGILLSVQNLELHRSMIGLYDVVQSHKRKENYLMT